MGDEHENTGDTNYNNGEQYLHSIWSFSQKVVEEIPNPESESNHTSRCDYRDKEYYENDIILWHSDSLN